MTSLKPILARVAAGSAMDEAEAEAAFDVIMAGDATPAQIAGLVTAMRVRGETVAELTGAVRAMRARMHPIEAPAGAIDVCGTGGDGAQTLNVSTAAAFVVAACGVPVAKHGNRALSSRAGAADVLTALGVDVDVPLDRLAGVLAEVGCAFLFAPRHHAALRHAAGPRVELGFRTIFNLLGPMANPAGVRRQFTGVFDPAWCAPMAAALGRLGTEACWVVHGGGLDELTVAGPSTVARWDGARVETTTIDPEALGLAQAPVEAIRGGDAAHNAAALLALLRGEQDAYADTVALNAAGALVVAGRVGDLPEGIVRARAAIASGGALAVLERLRDATRAKEAD